MEKNIRVVVVDSNNEVASSIVKHFRNNYEIEIVSCIDNGVDALNYFINNYKDFDLVVMDVLLPNMDGITILENLKNREFNKKIIVLSSFKDDYSIKKMVSLGVNYYMIKPFNLDSLEERIKDLYNESELLVGTNAEASLEMKICDCLHALGVPSHLRGYKYIKDGVLLMLTSGQSISYITKEIYPVVADIYNATPSRVERSIRNAIEISWERGDTDVINDMFGNSVDYERSKPTNTEFLNTIADRIRLSNKFVA